ncbi:hypothetical protein Tco_1002020 [Tanacetum coccineum]|uniref:Uncharacterized protein n=1 Tax=Tanacetum coccineum TaxID=301880 RepID=A0ABQ5F5G7_9ASTR
MKRKAQVQFEAQHYTSEDWDLIRAKLEANAELSKNILGSEIQGEDFAKKMVDLVNQRKKFFAEERAKAKRNKPMTQSQLKTYMMNYLKNQGTWKLVQLRKLSFEEVKEEFDKLVKQIESFVPMSFEEVKEEFDKLVKQIESFVPISFEATKANLKRFGEELQTKTLKRLKEEKDDEAKDVKPTKMDDLTELYRIVMKRYGMDGPEDKLEKEFWKCLRTMFEEPLSTDPIWSEIGQKRIISWRYYDTCRAHCLNLESMDVYMLSDRKYPLSAEMCQTMLKMKLLDGRMNEDCYRLLKMMEKQAGIKK